MRHTEPLLETCTSSSAMRPVGRREMHLPAGRPARPQNSQSQRNDPRSGGGNPRRQFAGKWECRQFRRSRQIAASPKLVRTKRWRPSRGLLGLATEFGCCRRSKSARAARAANAIAAAISRRCRIAARSIEAVAGPPACAHHQRVRFACRGGSRRQRGRASRSRRKADRSRRERRRAQSGGSSGQLSSLSTSRCA